MRLKLSGILCLWLVSLSLHAQLNTQNMLRQGQNAIFFDDYVTAIDNFNTIIRIKPFLSEPYFFRGVAKMSLEDNAGAIRDYDEAIELNPNYFLAYMYRGMAYNSIKNYEQALKDYNTAIAIDPGNPYVYANRGVTKSATGDYKGAEKDYSKALLIDNGLEAAYLNRALMRERLDDLKGAMEDCNAVIRLNMFSEDAYTLRGYLWYKQKDYHNAIEDFNRALKSNPESINVLMNRAMVYYEMKKYKETLADYTKAIEVDSQYIYAYYNRAMLRAEVGDYNHAIADLDKVVSMNPNNILVFFNRGLLKYEIKDYAGASHDFSESIRLYPDFVKAYMLRSVVHAELNNEAEAEADRVQAAAIIDRYKKMKAGDRNALIDTTENFKRLVDFNAKGDRIKDVINGQIQHKNVIVSLQDIFYVQYLNIDSLRKGRVQYYNRHVMEYNQAHNYSNTLTISNKRSVYPSGFMQENIAEQTKLIAEKQSFNPYFLRGIFYMENLDYSSAIEDFQFIIKKQPDHLLALFNEANARMLMYDYIESVDDKSPRIVGEENKTKWMVDYSKILEGYYKCLELDKEFVFALFNAANVYVKNEKIEQAIETYTRVIAMDGDMAEAYFNRGILYIYIGRKSEASADLSKAGEKGITDAYNIIKRYCN